MGTGPFAHCFDMAKTILTIFLLFLFLCNASVSSSVSASKASSLSYDFYKESCPDVEMIVFYVVLRKLDEVPNLAAMALRVYFHDCFVEGCDASVLIQSTEKNKAEKDAEINLSLPGDGFDVFLRVKRELELICPGVVSCADVMAIATRDLVHLREGPKWEVLKGRRDGLISKASRVPGNIPGANQTISELISLFHSKNLTTRDMVSLSGAHTTGLSHCTEFMPRIYSYNKTFDIDPSMDMDFALKLRAICPQNKNFSPLAMVNMDDSTGTIFDNAYYKNLLHGRGLLATDQRLYGDPITRGLVESMAKDQRLFFHGFAEAMHKLGSMEVKTGTDGEVRRQCDVFNT